MLDYLDSRGEDLLESGLGGKSIPGTILAAQMLMETMGQVDESAMIFWTVHSSAQLTTGL